MVAIIEFSDVARAVYRKNYAVLNGLTRSEVNTSDEDGRSPLMHATLDTEGDVSIVKLLVERGADVNAVDRLHQSTALHFAASLGKNDIAITLLDAGAAIDPVNRLGNTPLWEASMRPKANAAVIENLFKRGADPHKKNHMGMSAIDVARQGGHGGLLALFEGKSHEPG
jgi:uncharacterized protein